MSNFSNVLESTRIGDREQGGVSIATDMRSSLGVASCRRIEAVWLGIPPAVTAQQKGVTVRGGRPRFFTKAKVASAKALFRQAFGPFSPAVPMTGPVRVEVEYVFPFRATERRADREAGIVPHDTRPDMDNLSKALFDVLTDLRWWLDDGQICQPAARKWRGVQPGIWISVMEPDLDVMFYSQFFYDRS